MKDKIALMCKALSDENRLTILELLVKGETCGCTLIDKLPISQPTLSYHLNLLNEVGLTRVTKEGTWKKYKVDKEQIDVIITYLEELKHLEGMCDIV